MSSYIQMIVDHFEAGHPFEDFTFDFTQFKLLDKVTDDDYYYECIHAFEGEMINLFTKGEISYKYELHNHLIHLEAKATDWRNFAHNVAIRGGERMEQIKNIQSSF